MTRSARDVLVVVPEADDDDDDAVVCECGVENDPDAIFCKACGSEFDDEDGDDDDTCDDEE